MDENIGRCAWCGMIDHHLVDEACHICLPKIKSYSPTGNPSFDQMQIHEIFKRNDQNAELGIGAADIKTLENNHVPQK